MLAACRLRLKINRMHANCTDVPRGCARTPFRTTLRFLRLLCTSLIFDNCFDANWFDLMLTITCKWTVQQVSVGDVSLAAALTAQPPTLAAVSKDVPIAAAS